ncbi:hypothetical protein U9M48_017145 [Paspalum notatum var. saurae]|uniref:At1g61320/AtMIF1 LRR domain-containing protein n=1 Tax=Paspalum notatum var. saurae TaxID=547442 RepID=A0AAQ3WNB1_PASNO
MSMGVIEETEVMSINGKPQVPNHSGMGVKTFSLHTYPCSDVHPSYLQVAINPGIENVDLSILRSSMFGQSVIKYSFPCSVLSAEWRNSIQSFMLEGCSFHSTAQVGCMSSLKNLRLHSIHVTGEELYGFLSNSCALKQFYLFYCEDIICLKIPCFLKQLNIIHVSGCLKLEMIENNAPNISYLYYVGDPIIISLGHGLQVRKVHFRHHDSPGALYYARTKLPFLAPNVQTLALLTRVETISTPVSSGRFLRLKYLEIMFLVSQNYDFYSLVSFLDASPALETFILHSGGDSSRPRFLSECFHDHLMNVTITGFCSAKSMIELTIHILKKFKSPDSTFEDLGGDSSRPRFLSECFHDHLMNVTITGFCSAKSMIELTIHILKKFKSLGFADNGKCCQLSKDALVEVEKARLAAIAGTGSLSGACPGLPLIAG